MSPVTEPQPQISLPWFGLRKFAKKLALDAQTWRAERDSAQAQLQRILGMGQQLVVEVKELRVQRQTAFEQLELLGALPILELDKRRRELEQHVSAQLKQLEAMKRQIDEAQKNIIATADTALLQEVGVYEYRHPLSDVVAYETALERLQNNIKTMAKKEGWAVLATSDWTVNGSVTEGRAMVRDFSKLMLRAFNAEADTLVRALKPYKLNGALDRLKKIAETIEKLGKSMHIRIAPAYYQLRVDELELTADFLQKEAEKKETERLERERMREERKVLQEIERERARLAKERQHYANALDVLMAKGDEAGATRIREQLAEVDQNIESVDFRSANIRAGYVYVISNIGSFGERMIKVGMTRRLDPMDRIRELSDASVPFNFDVHALFFSEDAVGIETAMHDHLAHLRVNIVNHRREFFRATPLEVKSLLSNFSGELLEFQEFPEAIEFRQCMNSGKIKNLVSSA
jgi:hypothetical protein